MAGLPTNSGRAKDQGCNPVSSNCVVWQGPDLECIGLCKGDTISDVLAKMATQLCMLVDMFDLSEFDFTCLSVPVSEQPEDMGGLIQILIDRICVLENISPIDPSNPAGDCPDNCLVPIADCFYFINPQGDTVTTMTLVEYVNTIGNKICDILNDITALQDAVATLQEQQITTTSEIVDLELNKTDNSELQYQVSSKTNATAGVEFLPDATRFIENNTLAHFDAAGTPTETFQAVLKEGFFGEQEVAFGSGIYNSLPGWIAEPLNSAASLGNAWLAVNNMYDQVMYMKENCCSTGCSDIFLNFSVDLTGSILTLFTDGSTGFTPDWVECTGQTPVTITDTLGNSTTLNTGLIALIANPSGYQFDLTPTSVDFTTNLTVVADTCFNNTSTDTQCNAPYTDQVINSPDCPAVVLTAYATSVNYQFNSIPGYTYIINIYYNGGGVPVATQIITAPGALILQSILGLPAATAYDFEVVLVDGEGGETACPKQLFSTLAATCEPPINSSAIVTI
jgi:hypothetical protein